MLKGDDSMTSNLNPETGLGTAQPAGAAPAYTLFDSRAVALATFLGAPLAGSILMALNYRRLHRGGAAAAILAAGTILTAGAVFSSLAVPGPAARVWPILMSLLMMYGARVFQGAGVERHVRSGGGLGSRWVASGLGVAFALPFLFYMFYPADASRITVGTRDVIIYSGSATQQDAQALGQALRETGYFTDKGFTVVMAKGKGGAAVSFVVRDGAWNDSEVVTGVKEMARSIAPSAGGLPLKVRLVDSELKTKREASIE
jgi:hypothetical protein